METPREEPAPSATRRKRRPARTEAGARRGRVGTTSRVLVVIASLLPIAAAFFPLWKFDFEAPQYPEGLAMTIWAHKLGGQIQLINGLNHYVGMKAIEPDSFPELRILPWAIGGLMLFGLVAAAVGRLRLLAAWVITYALFAALALGDFYRWLYDYGNDLDPHAAIAMEPFTPPMIGSKTVMNFVVHAWPQPGGVAIILSFLIGVVALLFAVRESRREQAAATPMETA